MGQGTYDDKVSALVLYAVISAVMAMSWLLVFIYLQRHPQLLRPGVPADFFRTERLRALAGIIAPFFPVLIGLWSPPTALVVMVATPVFYAATAEGLKTPPPWHRGLGGRRLDVLEDRPVGMAGNEPGAVRCRRRPFDDLAASGSQRRHYRRKLTDQDRRYPVPVGGGVPGEQQERPDLGELNVAEAEPADRRDLCQLLVQRDRGS
jgi:hypothetical protein